MEKTVRGPKNGISNFAAGFFPAIYWPGRPLLLYETAKTHNDRRTTPKCESLYTGSGVAPQETSGSQFSFIAGQNIRSTQHKLTLGDETAKTNKKQFSAISRCRASAFTGSNTTLFTLSLSLSTLLQLLPPHYSTDKQSERIEPF